MKRSDYDLSRTEWENLINEWIFSSRNRDIMRARLLDGITHEQLAERFEMSVSQIQRIISGCRLILEKHIERK
jgi:ribosome-binding protein aMBF1 (putative translation factor)